jgi:hypothetical protein
VATTSPDNIWTPDSGDDYALTVDLAAMADTVQDALTEIHDNLDPLVEDTGWVDLNSLPGFDFSGTPQRAQVRRLGTVVHYRGGFTKQSGNFTGTYEDVGAIPTGFRPSRVSRTGAAGAAGRAGLMQFNTDGRILGAVQAGATNWVECMTSWLVD